MLLKLALRNIGRNKWRTAITAASIFFAVLFSSFMNSFQKGVWDRMIDNFLSSYFGYIQIQGKSYWEEQSLDYAFYVENDLNDLKEKVAGIKGLIPRLESFALAAHEQKISGTMVVGIDPAQENSFSGLKKKMSKGKYLKSGDHGAMLAEGLASYLGIEVNDTIVLIGQGYHGANAAGKYPVRGFLKFPSPDLNKKMIYLTLVEAQRLYAAEQMLTSLVIHLKDNDDYQSVKKDIYSKLDSSRYEIMQWDEMLPELVDAKKSDSAGNYIFILVLYMIISFGIFGTIMMMLKEREFEFGILTGIGMSRRMLAYVTWLEIVIMGLIGAIAGIAGCIPLVYYFYKNPLNLADYMKEMSEVYAKWGFDPLMPAAFEIGIFINQALLVFAITTILAGYAIYKIMRIKPIEAMRK
jgi:putative ABC transport system permease protein